MLPILLSVSVADPDSFRLTWVRLDQKWCSEAIYGMEMQNRHFTASIDFKKKKKNILFSLFLTERSNIITISIVSVQTYRTQGATSTESNHSHFLRIPIVKLKFHSDRFFRVQHLHAKNSLKYMKPILLTPNIG